MQNTNRIRVCVFKPEVVEGVFQNRKMDFFIPMVGSGEWLLFGHKGINDFQNIKQKVIKT